MGGVCGAEGGLGDHDVEFRVVEWSDGYTDSCIYWRVDAA
jgi:hypothetical protein